MGFKTKEESAAYFRQYYLRNKEKAAAQRKARYARKRDIERQQQAEYRAANLDAIREQQRAYREANRDEINSRQRKRRAASPETYRAKERARIKTPEQRAASVEKARRWQLENRDRYLEWVRKYRQRRIACDPIFKVKIAMRRRFYMALRNQVYDGWNIRSGEAVRLLGCTMAEFIKHIESLWTDGMTWGNWTRDGWHIDHIVPLSAFDLADAEQIKAACHYTNLRPLWATDNLQKGAKVDASIIGKDAHK